jgi:phenylalanyl-tRNA synthetase beta chain
MKIAYKHLVDRIISRPSIDQISDKLYQLGHEHEIDNGVYEMEFTPNRGDCLSINGLLRDLAIFYEVELDGKIYNNKLSTLELPFKNKSEKYCPYISFLKIDVAEIQSSYADELKSYFDDLDLKPNNFFTDVSNFISYETGQPTHCYDAAQINNFSLELINTEYEFQTLLGKKIKLSGENLVFMQNNNVINLAGVMGGKSTACSPSTKSVIIECAYFDPEKIIGKSVKYDLSSDAAHKFERGVDPMCHEKVLRRFLKIVESHSKIISAEIFLKNYEEFSPIEVHCNENDINKILGTSIDKNQFDNYLFKLGFIVQGNAIKVPSHRSDIKMSNDIAEEIARAIGYNNILIEPFLIPSNKKNTNFFKTEFGIKNSLIDNGFFEVINNPFVSNKTTGSIQIDNPLDSNRKYLRTDLQKSLVENLLYNERRQKDSIKLFEISDVYSSNEKINSKKLLGIICSGRASKDYLGFSKKIDLKFLTDILSNFVPNHALEPIYISREELNTKIKSRIVYFEIEIKKLNNLNEEYKNPPIKQLESGFIKYNSISEFPSSTRDLSFSIKDEQNYYELQDFISSYNDDLIKEIYIFDFFYNEKNDEIKVGYRFIFQSHIATIREAQVNSIIKDIIDYVATMRFVEVPGLAVK